MSNLNSQFLSKKNMYVSKDEITLEPFNKISETTFIYLGFYIAFNTVQVISRRVVERAETST